jgi:hypothetical protein
VHNEQRLLAQQQKNEEEQRQMAYQHQTRAGTISEKELVTLRNEKLESEIEYKNSELAYNSHERWCRRKSLW